MSSSDEKSCAHDPDGSGVVDPRSATTLPLPHVSDRRAETGGSSVNGRDSVSRCPELSGEYLAPPPCQLEPGQRQLVAGVVGGRPVRYVLYHLNLNYDFKKIIKSLII